MPNIVTDPSHELDLGWSFAAGASRSSLAAHTGTWSARLPKLVGELTGGRVERMDLPLTSGQIYAVSVWANGATAIDASVRIEVDPGDGNWISLGDLPPNADWTLWAPGSFTAVGTTGGVRATNLSSTNGRIWYLDDWTIEPSAGDEMAYRSALAYDALFDLIAGINGSTGGYWTNLEGRVLPYLVTPDEGTSIKLPYACLPLVGAPESPSAERDYFDVVWSLRGWLFLPGPLMGSTPTTNELKAVLDAKDDLYRALQPLQTLSGTVRDASIDSIESHFGVAGVGEIEFVVSMRSFFQRSNLGPDGV